MAYNLKDVAKKAAEKKEAMFANQIKMIQTKFSNSTYIPTLSNLYINHSDVYNM